MTASIVRLERRATALSAIVALPSLLGAFAAPALAQVSDRGFEKPPYYAGKASSEAVRVGHFPVVYQAGGSHEPIFDPPDTPGSTVAALLEEMNEWLLATGGTIPLFMPTAASSESLPTGSGRPAPTNPPDVTFGCDPDPSGECEVRDPGEALGRSGTRMRLAHTGPSRAWRDWASETLREAEVDAALVLTLEVGQYWIRQKGLRGDKQVELGTGHVQALPWLTSLETPVTVLQLTGALVDAEGRVRRIGTEGLVARRTAFRLSVVGAQELITDEDVGLLRSARRDDLPGRPLVWEAALQALLEGLTR